MVGTTHAEETISQNNEDTTSDIVPSEPANTSTLNNARISNDSGQGSYANAASRQGGENSKMEFRSPPPENLGKLQSNRPVISRTQCEGSRYIDPLLYVGDIKHLYDLKYKEPLKEVIRGLQREQLWPLPGLHLRRRNVEVRVDNEDMAARLETAAVTIGGRQINFRPATQPGITVSLIGLPLYYPIGDVKDQMSTFSEILDAYALRKRDHEGKPFVTATVMIRYKKMEEPIPRQLYFNSIPLRAVYTGQDLALAEWERKKLEDAHTGKT